VSLGPTIDSTQTAARLEMLQGGFIVDPIAAYGDDWIVTVRNPRQADPNVASVYELWSPVTGETKPAWQGVPKTQNSVQDVSGDWLLTVRIGLSLPFEDWQLILRNLKTGQQIQVAKSDPNVVKVPGLPLRLPGGLAPIASMSGTLVVWPEFVVNSNGEPVERIQLYDMEKETRETLVSVDPRIEDLWQPSIAGTRVAWAHRAAPTGIQELVLLDLKTGTKTTFPVGGEIFECTLSADARYLAWDDSYTTKYALDVQTGERVQYASDEGWGTFRSGHYVAWQPKQPGGYGGFYDFAKKEVRFLPSFSDPVVVNLATVMGGWFVWQELHRTIDPNKVGPPDISGSYYYFLRLPP
jgi:hypothetical protein